MKRPIIRKSLRRLAIALGVVAVAVLLLVLWLVSIHKLCSEDGEQHWCVVRKSIFEHVMRNQRMAVHATDAEGHSVEMITRIVARPGDTVEINDGFVYVNGKAINEPSKAKCSFVISQHASFKLLHQLERIADGQTLNACDTIRFQLDEIKPEWKRFLRAPELRNIPDRRLYPYSDIVQWNAYHMGPFRLPSKGDTIVMNSRNYVIYKPVIEQYEGVTIEKGMTHVIENDYYWSMSDDRDVCFDSRFFGPIADDDILGIVELKL